MRINGLRLKGGSMVALEFLFIHNLNIPYSTSSCQQSSKGHTTKFDSLDLNIFGSYTMPLKLPSVWQNFPHIEATTNIMGYNAHGITRSIMKGTIVQLIDQLGSYTY
jgi:hypothetical protein